MSGLRLVENLATRFEVTVDHLRLMRRMVVNWQPDEYGAPEIDPKRPYGNSSVEMDIAEILGVPLGPDEDDPMKDVDTEQLRRLHEETLHALQIALVTGSFETGTYECDRYRRNWRKVRP